MTEKRVLAAAVLSSVFLAWYMQVVMKWDRRGIEGRRSVIEAGQKKAGDAVERSANGFLLGQRAEEPVALVQSDTLEVEIGEKSGLVRRVRLKKFQDSSGMSALSFGGETAIFGIGRKDRSESFEIGEKKENAITLLAGIGVRDGLQLIYELDESKPILRVLIRSDAETPPAATLFSSWQRGDALGTRQNQLELVAMVEEGGKKRYKRYGAPGNAGREVPRGTVLFSVVDRHFCESVKLEEALLSGVLLPAKKEALSVISQIVLPLETTERATLVATVYFGPRDYFHLRQAGFSNAFHIGMLEQIGLILLVALRWLGGITGNYGLAVIIFSGVITAAMAPFTLISIRSMKKMQALKPLTDRVTAHYKGDPGRANQEIMRLYKEHRVSPASGCLPMLLQMPVFIALFQTISHFIELRGASFLWMKDLSLPDRLARLPVALPIIGNELNALPIIMSIAMYVQTKFSKMGTGAGEANPAAKIMAGPIMPILFGVMFYQFPAGMVLYWLTNSLLSLGIYKIAGGSSA